MTITSRGDTPSHQATSISVVTLVWRDFALLPRFSEFLEASVNQARVEVELIIVCNGLVGQPALDAWKAEFHNPLFRVTVTTLEENLGFTGGAVHGLAKTTSDIIVLANLDVEFDPEFFTHLNEDHHQLAGESFLAPSIFTPRPGHLLPRAVTDDGVLRRDWLLRLREFHGDRSPGCSVPSPNASCLVFSRALMLRRVAALGDFFDPEYRTYYEDVDLFWWAELESIPRWYRPDLRVVHRHGGSVDGKIRFKERPAAARVSMMANYRLTVWKNARHAGAIFGWFAGEIGYVLMSIITDGPWSGLRTYAQSWAVARERVRSIRSRRGSLRPLPSTK